MSQRAMLGLGVSDHELTLSAVTHSSKRLSPVCVCSSVWVSVNVCANTACAVGLGSTRQTTHSPGSGHSTGPRSFLSSCQ